jgi:hypothetical protein
VLGLHPNRGTTYSAEFLRDRALRAVALVDVVGVSSLVVVLKTLVSGVSESACCERTHYEDHGQTITRVRAAVGLEVALLRR